MARNITLEQPLKSELPAPSMVEIRRPALVPTNMTEAIKLAELMAQCNLVPKDLQKKPADCLMIIDLAVRWEMDPFAVAQECSVVQGKLMPSGKLTAAVVNARGNLAQRLSYRFNGEGDDRSICVSGLLRGETEPRTVEVILRNVRTTNAMWTKQPDQQLMYSGARVWARRHVPELMLGIWTREEFDTADTADETIPDHPWGKNGYGNGHSISSPGEYDPPPGQPTHKQEKAIEEGKPLPKPPLTQNDLYEALCDEADELINEGIGPIQLEQWAKEIYPRRMMLKGEYSDAFNRYWLMAHKTVHDNWVSASAEREKQQKISERAIAQRNAPYVMGRPSRQPAKPDEDDPEAIADMLRS